MNHRGFSKPGVSFLALLLILPACLVEGQQVLKPFPPETRLVGAGDSITHFGLYLLYLDVFYQTRFPQSNIEIFDAGISGDTADGGLRRYGWDIATHKPTVVSIMFGMNDVNRDLYSEATASPEVEKQRAAYIENWDRNTLALVNRAKQEGAQVILITPSIFDDSSTMASRNYPGCNGGLGKIATLAEEMAKRENLGLVDFYHPMLALNRKLQALDPAATIVGPDRVHPGNAGHLLMAYLFLKAQGVSPEIAQVALDGSNGNVTRNSGCTVDEVKVEVGGISFRYLAQALPFPIDPAAVEATRWEPGIEALNQENLTISRLSPGRYELTIDGKKLGTYREDEWARGINLAKETSAPQYQQAVKVMDLCKSKWGSIWCLRAIALGDNWAPDLPHPTTLDQMQPTLEAKLKQTADGPWAKSVAHDVAKYRELKGQEAKIQGDVAWMTEEIRKAAQPVPHVVRVKLVSSN